MISETAFPFAPARIDALALLGVRDPDDGIDWRPIRAHQLLAARGLALFLLAANVVAAALTVVIGSGGAPFWQVGAWGALCVAVAAAVAFRRLRPPADLAESDARAVRWAPAEGLALGVVWAAPPLVFGHGATIAVLLGHWLVLSYLMLAVAIAMAALPLAAMTFAGVTGGAMAVALLAAGTPGLAVIVLVFSGLCALTCVQRTRALIRHRLSEAAVAERDATVSLLLNDQGDDSDWLWEVDAQRRVLRASRRFAHAIGAAPDAVNGASLLEVLAGPSWETGAFAPGLHRLAEKLKARQSFRNVVLPVDVGGAQRWWELSATPRADHRGAFIGFRGVASDVTDVRESAEKINRLARYDTLTGLPNRLLVNEALGRAMAEAERWSSRCGFMMIDLDRFKAVNDSLGHPVGDRLLALVAERLRRLVTDNEMIGRLGGDEFAVVVRDATDMPRVETLARTIIATLSAPYEVDRHTLYIGASVGMAVGPRDGRAPETLIRSADLALYRSKDAGGGSFHLYEPQLHVRAEERRVLEIALRQALEQDQLHLTYQPVVDAETGGLTGFEALLRWTHPEMGQIPPAKFVPLAEDARLIVPIGEWVLNAACLEAARWTTPFRIAVNVSAAQLHNPGFVGIVTHALRASGLPAERLELEVTESVFMREGTAAIATLERILDLGVRLSLDDFGIGYSSLGYLSRTRFSSIKIDRSFVQAASRGGKEAIAIIRAVVALAQSLGMATIAEGVETEEEHRLVRHLGCTKLQGYHFGRPLPVEEARALAALRSGGYDDACAA